jgi:hypothetical protein
VPAPTTDDVRDYLGVDAPSEADVAAALAAEKVAQAHWCDVPLDSEPWPADLAEALCRRVAHNLAVRSNPTGVQTAESEFGVTQLRVGGLDAEVRRLEGPYRSFGIA